MNISEEERAKIIQERADLDAALSKYLKKTAQEEEERQRKEEERAKDKRRQEVDTKVRMILSYLRQISNKSMTTKGKKQKERAESGWTEQNRRTSQKQKERYW